MSVPLAGLRVAEFGDSLAWKKPTTLHPSKKLLHRFTNILKGARDTISHPSFIIILITRLRMSTHPANVSAGPE